MKITVIEDKSKEETQIRISCRKRDRFIDRIVKKLYQENIILKGRKDSEHLNIPINDIYYIETVDKKTYIYCEKEVYQNDMKIYELEKLLLGTSFIRISKSTVLNINKIEKVKGQINGRLIASLLNGEKIIVNRSYAHDLKDKLKNSI